MPDDIRINLDALRADQIQASASEILKRIRESAPALQDLSAARNAFRKTGKTGFALSGGGAKGSFQVGALRFLMEVRGIRPDMIAGTSVGAVNGCKLAEGGKKPADDRAYKPGLEGLVDIWHGLQKDEDMAKPIVDFQKLIAAIAGELGEISASIFGAGVILGVDMLGLAPFLQCLVGEAVSSVEEIKRLVTRALYSGGIWSLDPVREMIRDKKKFRPDLFEKSGIEMMICWVGMLSGKTFYVDNQKRLYVSPNFMHPAGTVDRLTDAIHASAAIPIVFRPPVVKGEWGGRRFAEIGFDGGVTEVAPVEVLQARGATQIFAIVCSPAAIPDLVTGVVGEAEESVFRTMPAIELEGIRPKKVEKHLAEMPALQFLFTIGTRALDIATSEILRDDLRTPDGPITEIRPYVLVHETQQIDHELITINEDHGWMCAFDAEIPPHRTALMRGREMKLPNLARKFAADTNKAITMARRERCMALRIVRLMKLRKMREIVGAGRASKFVDFYGALAEKNNGVIREAVEARRQRLGLDSVPVLASGWDD